MGVQRLGWLGVRTPQLDEMRVLLEGALELEPFHGEAASSRERLAD